MCIIAKSSSFCEHFKVLEGAVSKIKAEWVLNVNTKVVIESVIVIDPKSVHSRIVIIIVFGAVWYCVLVYHVIEYTLVRREV